MEKTYDIAIIGAGPAGLASLMSIQKQTQSISVAIIEKNSPHKLIPCAEGCGTLGLNEVVKPKQTWIRHVVGSAIFHSPDNTEISYADPNKGYIINRELMQNDILYECRNKDNLDYFNERVDSVSQPDISCNRLLTFTNNKSIKARIVLDCSGPLSRFGNSEKISFRANDLEIAYFAHVSGISLPKDSVHLYVGRSIAPGGYAWVFPHSADIFNIGLVLGSGFKGKVRIDTMLKTFLENYFPKATVIRTCAGTIPCYTKRQPIAVSGLIKSGDAASTVNPISRAGIVEAMKSGTIAGDHALAMLGASTEKNVKKICTLYEKAWYEKLGSSHNQLAKVKQSLLKISDEEYNRGAHALVSIPDSERTMSKIFSTCLGKFPKLVWALRHLM